MTGVTHCRACSLRHDHPGVTLGHDGLCNLCRLEVPSTMVENYQLSQDNYRAFLASTPRADSAHDCLFMYSGGKDSTYMLDRFVNVEHRRVLSYTFDIPFQSEHALENIAKIREVIAAEYFIDAADDKIRSLMRHVFNAVAARKPGSYLDEKTPCMLCRDFFVLRAIVLAFKKQIPFLIFCADPQQIITIQSDIRKIIQGFYARVGRDVTHELFGDELEDILFADAATYPKIVFPYIGMRHAYHPERMIQELKAKGLYTSSPLETHCTLFPLLNYYSFKNYDCSFYRLNMASQVRGGHDAPGGQAATFGIKFNSDDSAMIETEARYKRVIMDIVENRANRDEQQRELAAVFASMGFDDPSSSYLIAKYMALHELATDMQIELSASAPPRRMLKLVPQE